MAAREEHISDEVFSERLDGRLTLAEIRRIDEHLSRCVECSARADALAAVRDRLRALGTAPLPRDFRLDPSGGRDRLSGPRSATRARPGWAIGRIASAAALLAGIMLLVGGFASLYSTTAANHPVAAYSAASTSTNPARTATSSQRPGATAGGTYSNANPSPTGTAPAPTPVPAHENGPASDTSHSSSPTQPLWPFGPVVPIAAGALALVAGIAGLRRTRPARR
jgi:hypothetical protein